MVLSSDDVSRLAVCVARGKSEGHLSGSCPSDDISSWPKTTRLKVLAQRATSVGRQPSFRR